MTKLRSMREHCSKEIVINADAGSFFVCLALLFFFLLGIISEVWHFGEPIRPIKTWSEWFSTGALLVSCGLLATVPFHRGLRALLVLAIGVPLLFKLAVTCLGVSSSELMSMSILSSTIDLVSIIAAFIWLLLELKGMLRYV